MTTQRIKIKLPLITTRNEAEATMNDLCLAANNRRKLAARMDAAVLKIQEEAAPGIAQCDADIKAKTDSLCAWAEAHPEEFGKRKSIDFLAGTLGFRTGTPKLKLLARWNWVAVLDAIQQRAFSFIRNTPEVDKEAIISFFTSSEDKPAVVANVLTPIGVKVVQEESFFVEPNLTPEA